MPASVMLVSASRARSPAAAPWPTDSTAHASNWITGPTSTSTSNTHGSREILGLDPGLLFTGTILGLIVAYVVRFQALAFFSVDARMRRVDPALDDAARSLGADPNRVLSDVHLPLLWPGIVTAALLVFVEVMKELPATALLRPLGGDTLAVAVWEATRDSRFEVAALPALLIVAVGLVPVVLAIRYSRGGAATLVGANADGGDQRSDLDPRG